MLDLTFGEQVKIVLSRKGMTIKELAELIEERTGKKMSRQNLTQRLSRDNFQEQDMRMIAAILECPLRLSILDDSVQNEKISYYNVNNREDNMPKQEPEETVREAGHEPEPVMENERDITIGELVDIHEELDALAQNRQAASRAEEHIAAADAGAAESDWPAPDYELSEDYGSAEPGETADEAASDYRVASDYEAASDYGTVSDYGTASEYRMAAGDAPAPEAVLGDGYEPEQSAVREDAYVEGDGSEPTVEEILEEVAALEAEQRQGEKSAKAASQEKPHGWKAYLQRRKKKDDSRLAESEAELASAAEKTSVPEESVPPVSAPVPEYEESDYGEPEYEEPKEMYEEELTVEAAEEPVGDINPYTGREYESNSVRMHPKRIGYVQVYDRDEHQWTDMTEWAFLGYQERKKALLGKDYDPPIYLD